MPVRRCKLQVTRVTLDSTQTRKRTSEVDSTALGDPRVCSQPGRKGQGIPRVCHRSQHQCRGSPGGGAPLLAQGSAGFVGNPQRASGRNCRPSTSDSNASGARHPRKPRRGISSARPQILPPSAQWRFPDALRTWETCFCNVKIFSYRLDGRFCTAIPKSAWMNQSSQLE